MLKPWLRGYDFAKRRVLQASPTWIQGFRSIRCIWTMCLKCDVHLKSLLNSIIQITRFEPSKIRWSNYEILRKTDTGKDLDGPHGPPLPLLCHGGAVLGRRPGGRWIREKSMVKRNFMAQHGSIFCDKFLVFVFTALFSFLHACPWRLSLLIQMEKGEKGWDWCMLQLACPEGPEQRERER